MTEFESVIQLGMLRSTVALRLVTDTGDSFPMDFTMSGFIHFSADRVSEQTREYINR